MKTGPMVVSDGGGYPIEGNIIRYFGRWKGAEATGLRNAWQEGQSAGEGKK